MVYQKIKLSVTSQLALPPVLDHFQCVNVEAESLGNHITCGDVMYSPNLVLISPQRTEQWALLTRSYESSSL